MHSYQRVRDVVI